jgi:hypothetical protein
LTREAWKMAEGSPLFENRWWWKGGNWGISLFTVPVVQGGTPANPTFALWINSIETYMYIDTIITPTLKMEAEFTSETLSTLQISIRFKVASAAPTSIMTHRDVQNSEVELLNRNYAGEFLLHIVYIYIYSIVGCGCTVIFKGCVIVPTCNCKVLFHFSAPSESCGVPIKFPQSIHLFLSARMKQRETYLGVRSKHFSLRWKLASDARDESRKRPACFHVVPLISVWF